MSREYKIRIDEQVHTVSEPEPTGQALLHLVGKNPDTHALTLVIEGADDEFVDADETVDLREPGRERFTVVAKDFKITIDEKVYQPQKRKMLGSELRALPNPDIAGDRDLWLDIPGKDDQFIEPSQLVKLKDGMVFYSAPATINPGRD